MLTEIKLQNINYCHEVMMIMIIYVKLVMMMMMKQI